MTRYFFVFLFCCITLPALAQYYLRGDVKDAQGKSLPNVRIYLTSKGNFPFYTGSSGGFGLPSSLKIDTVTLILEGYENLKVAVNTSVYHALVLKMVGNKSNSSTRKLSSFSKEQLDGQSSLSQLGESYSATIENHFIQANVYPETGFALHVDRASYSNIRRFLTAKSKPPADAVRIEEMLNYFNFTTTAPADVQETFVAKTYLTSCPWNKDNRLFYITLQAKKINLDKTPASNLVFLIDVSGSMDMPNRLPLLKSGFKLLVENLRTKDTISIITYGDQVAVQLPPTSGSNKQKILEAIEGLTPAGSTPGESAIRAAYKLANHSFIKGGNNRVILATDGDFNVGQTSEKELEELISQQRQSGIYLTCLGVGMGNYKDSKLEALARKGNGNFAYLDNEREAEKVLVEEFAQTLYTVANDVYMNVNFNPAMVKSYRLIGFDNRADAIADTSSELEGGEVGSGHSLLSMFEIVPGREMKTDSLGKNKFTLATLQLSYRSNGTNDVEKIHIESAPAFTPIKQADSCLRFAAAVTMFGSMLKQSAVAKELNWEMIEAVAHSAASKTDLLQQEFIHLIEQAKKIYAPRKKKKDSMVEF